MPVPERVRVKLSSENAGYIALTPVVVQDLSFVELIEQILGATGKDATRVSELLKRGTLVAGASRLRWASIEAGSAEIGPILDALPGPEPERPFQPGNCQRVVLTGPSTRLEISREAASQRRLLKKSSFWDALIAESAGSAYVAYHYRERADQYRLALTPPAIARLKEAAALLKFDAIERQVRAAAFHAIEYYATRQPAA